jgi:hypothetical protein
VLQVELKNWGMLFGEANSETGHAGRFVSLNAISPSDPSLDTG